MGRTRVVRAVERACKRGTAHLLLCFPPSSWPDVPTISDLPVPCCPAPPRMPYSHLSAISRRMSTLRLARGSEVKM